jgi:RsiW-degrading membrane proteinase PrsW (M82 family)
VTAVVTAGAGFLLSVLWFDLMFDVQTLRHRRGAIPEDVLASIAAYYRRVTTTARPMNRLVALVMLGTLIALVIQLVQDDVPRWTAVTSLALAVVAIGLAVSRTFGAARRLGTRSDPIDRQSALAHGVCRDHLVCLVLIAALLVVQLGLAR